MSLTAEKQAHYKTINSEFTGKGIQGHDGGECWGLPIMTEGKLQTLKITRFGGKGIQ